MALMICPECGKEISESAVACPFCGYPLKKVEKPKRLSAVAIVIIAVAAVLCLSVAVTVGLVVGLKNDGGNPSVSASGFSGSGSGNVGGNAGNSVSAAEFDGRNEGNAYDEEIEVGDIVEFGHYPQTADGTDNTPIEWIVLARDGDRALLLSKYGLDAQPYNEEGESVTWETCTLRGWLNDDFLNRAFTAEEQSGIVLATVTADKSSQFDTNPGNDTRDRVFLLSIEEAEALFATDEARICKPTAYADAYGTLTNDSGACWWWLRSPGLFNNTAAYVGCGGALNGSRVVRDSGAVRPALWVNLKS